MKLSQLPGEVELGAGVGGGEEDVQRAALLTGSRVGATNATIQAAILA